MLLLLAVLALLALLAARVDASPEPAGTPGADEPATDELEGGGALLDELALAAPTSGPPEALLAPGALAAAARTAPNLRATLASAYRAAGLDDDPSPGFARRSRLSALVPWVSVQVGQNDTWHDVVDPTIGHAVVFDVRAAWHLDRLAFDPTELRAAAMHVARRRDRRRLALAVSRAYFMWLRARAAASQAPAWALRADEAAAALDALTDGAWSRPPA